MKTLSICIPTYNRVKQLRELVFSILEVQSDDFEVVVTNNCSTDGTLEMLESIKDERLIIYTNENPVPAYYNIIISIFNATGRYALYCNDRDVIFCERLVSFIEFIKRRNYSFLHIVNSYGNPTFRLKEYEKGFDSLSNHPYCDHPTGYVFNVQLMKQYLNCENYKKYIPYVYTWCFLGRELVIYEKSAEYDNYLWDERPSIFKVQSASGAVYKGQLFFETEKVIDYMKGAVAHLIGNSYFSLSYEQQKYLILDVFMKLSGRVMGEKLYYADKRECAHYGIRPKFISYLGLKKSYNHYFEECDKTLMNTIYYDELMDDWFKRKRKIQKSLLKISIGLDISIIKRSFKRFFYPNYRY